VFRGTFSENVAERVNFIGGEHWVDLGVDGWIILGWISRRWVVGIWTGLGWLRIQRVGGCL